MIDDYAEWPDDYATEEPPEPPYDWATFELGEWAWHWAEANADYLDWTDKLAAEPCRACLAVRQRRADPRSYCFAHPVGFVYRRAS